MSHAQEILNAEYASGFKIERWPQGPRIPPRFSSAESSFIVGSTHRGKSRLLMRLAKKFQRKGKIKLYDAFGAENDSESCMWLLDPEYRDSTAIIIGNEVKVEGWDNVIPIQNFTLEKVKDYSVIVTDRALFGPYSERKWDQKYYSALARIFDSLNRRADQTDLNVLCVREVWNLVYSVIKAGISRDAQEAQDEFSKMHRQRYHSNVATIMDTQRYTELAASVRTLVDYRYFKGFGAQPIPAELHFLFKPHLFGSIPKLWKNPRERMVRGMPIDQYILLTKDNGVALGWYADIPWHLKKGFSPLRKLGITVTLKQREEDTERKVNDAWQEAKRLPSNNDLHKRMVEMKAQGQPYKTIAQKLSDEGIPTTWQKVQYHLRNVCACNSSHNESITPKTPINVPQDIMEEVNPYTAS